MRVLLLTDADVAIRERSLLERLAVGIADEGARVAMASPRAVSSAESPTLIQHFGFDPPAPLLGARHQAENFRDSLHEAGFITDASSLDIIHVFGSNVTELALALGGIERCGVVVESASRAMNQDAHRIMRSIRRRSAPGPLVWTTPSADLRDELAALAPETECRHIPWGVHTASAKESGDSNDDPLGVVMLVNRRLGAVGAAILEGISEAARAIDREIIVICDDAVARQDHRFWRTAKKLDMLSRVSLVSSLEARRDPVLNADLFISACAPGEHRSMVLDAMGHAVAIVSLDDPMIDWNHAGETGQVVRQSTPGAWAAAIQPLLRDDAERHSLGERARAWARANRAASGHVRLTLQLYDWIAARAEGTKVEGQ